MEAFVWTQCFVTGLETVDEQHRRLVDIINRVGDILMTGGKTGDDMQGVFVELADYARLHFADEERLMAEAGVDPRHAGPHRARHAEFIEEVTQMWRSRTSLGNPAETLHGFLVAWLSFHILDEDQSMVRQVLAIRGGTPAAKAFDAECRARDNNVATLVSALQALYRVTMLQSRQLIEANAELERKVEERTFELRAANARLAAEQKDIAALLEKVEEAQGQILQSEKLAAIGQLAAGVAHEINNPIGFVNSNLGTLRNYVDSLLRLIDAYEQCIADAKLQSPRLDALEQEADLEFLRTDITALLNESRDGLDRVKKIVQDLKDFSHVDAAEFQLADINAGLESTLNVVWNELKYKAEVVRQYGELPLVRCIPGQLNQVFMNLLVNAAQAIEKRGSITVRTAAKDGWVSVEIADTGHGMKPEILNRLFEPFFTTKPIGKGTGLGLSLSWDIVVKKHGGRFEVESEAGKGSTFRVWLPVGGTGA